ncbi:hypothetical protein NA57DRAFT_51090 [Rhizodiscina lignyota]|uniref:Nonsense-mediated mRNA decay factor n=1 Tax=Rhizodiscina lignyota TaxID=1504668 RepID=A0A9P4IRW0_9PEZI|nr:hypothetical protein NA57DRAFT_51090 [Rhizodiscina lignyota]
MATSFEDALHLRRFQTIDASLAELFATPESPHAHIATTLSEYRHAGRSVTYANFHEAIRLNVEEQVWQAHTKANSRYRKDLQELKRRPQNSAVEIRKLSKDYQTFLKSAQRFYRSNICELDMQYHGGIPELRKAARKMDPDEAGSGSSSGNPPDADTCRKLVLSCYHSLNHLGDLSRYREAEAKKDHPDWRPAIGYYNLAIEIYPFSGVSYHQRAIIALADSHHLRTVYYLYRSQTVHDPYALGPQNLEIEFKKITTAWEKGEPIKQGPSRDGNASTHTLVTWFVRLHSKCRLGEDFAGHRELEDEVLGQLAQAIKQQSLDDLFRRLVLTNISAEWYTVQRTQGLFLPPESALTVDSLTVKIGDKTSTEVIKAYQFYLRLNIRTFTTLLQVLLDELELPVNARSDDKLPEVSVIARRALPAVRLYSYWLSEQVQVLSAKVASPSIRQRLEEMWRVYGAVLTKGVSTILDGGLPNIDYLFEEDADIIGFLPLASERTHKAWYSKQGNLKPRFSDEGVELHHPTTEALIRLKDLVLGGVELISKAPGDPELERVPLVYDKYRFHYKPDYDLTKSLGGGAQKEASMKNADTTMEVMENVPQPAEKVTAAPVRQLNDPLARTTSRTTSDSTSVTKEVSMNHMVDTLVRDDEGLDPVPEEEHNLPLTPPANFDNVPMVRNASNTITPLTASDLVQQVQNWGQSKSSPNPVYAPQGSTMSPFLKNTPSPRQHPDPWTRAPPNSGPSSPYQAVAPYSVRSPVANAVTPSNSLHIRGTSLQPLRTDMYNETLSTSRPSTARTITPTLPRSNQFEEIRQVWGVTPNVPTAEWVRMRQPRYGEPGANAMNSSMLFGNAGGPWSAGPSRSSTDQEHAWSPMNGQGGKG